MPKNSDWIGDFLQYTEGLQTADHFRLWAGITCLGAALERRVWTMMTRKVIFPNCFTILVARPGIGKSMIIDPVEKLWRGTGNLTVSPTSVTRAGLADRLMSAAKTIPTKDGEILEYSSVLCASSEFGNLVPKADSEFLSVLNHTYDNPPRYDEGRRTVEHPADVTNPQLSILAGSTPSFLGDLLDEAAWAQGFPSRLLMIYASHSPKADLFGDTDPRTELWLSLQSRVTAMAHDDFAGLMVWAEDAVEYLRDWYKMDLAPVPSHPRLLHYVPRRIVHIAKLSMISSVSRGPSFIIARQDVERAKTWLLNNEISMGEVFLEISNKSDSQLLREMHMTFWLPWTLDKKPITKSQIWAFFRERAPGNKIDYLVTTAINSGVLVRAGPDTYTPRAWADR